MPKFQGVDYLDLDGLLSADERLVRTTIREFVDDRVLPVIEKHNRAGTFPMDLVPAMAELGLFGSEWFTSHPTVKLDSIVAQLEAAGKEVSRDAFGHVRIDKINPGAWFADQFAAKLGAEKVMVQKSGYYARSAAANQYDLDLIKSMTDLAVDSALRGEPGVIGHDEEDGDTLKAIAFDRIKGGKPFDISQAWFTELLHEIGQPAPVAAQTH